MRFGEGQEEKGRGYGTRKGEEGRSRRPLWFTPGPAGCLARPGGSVHAVLFGPQQHSERRVFNPMGRMGKLRFREIGSFVPAHAAEG